MRFSLPGRLVAAGLLLVGLSACTESEPEPTAQLQRFYDQKLSFGPCSGYATTLADDKVISGDP
ncbi:hypothetical protein [Nocardia sp. NPDC051832]|uniref:hypothetical protein n=1 Tax=Nocardia sp. NPDC051832 TaxID=3155673 RepID=UPI00343491CE